MHEHMNEIQGIITKMNDRNEQFGDCINLKYEHNLVMVPWGNDQVSSQTSDEEQSEETTTKVVEKEEVVDTVLGKSQVVNQIIQNLEVYNLKQKLKNTAQIEPKIEYTLQFLQKKIKGDLTSICEKLCLEFMQQIVSRNRTK